MLTPNQQVLILKQSLYKQFVINSPFSTYNRKHIDWVLSHVYKKQISNYNPNEEKVISFLSNNNIKCQTQTPIPILSEGGKLQHLYLADITVGNTIIEVDGPQHLKHLQYDMNRDTLTSQLGYNTIRIPTDDLSKDTLATYLKDLL